MPVKYPLLSVRPVTKKGVTKKGAKKDKIFSVNDVKTIIKKAKKTLDAKDKKKMTLAEINTMTAKALKTAKLTNAPVIVTVQTPTAKTMNPEIKTKWIKALASGKYKKGEGALKKINDDGKREYCCLGVLCDMYRLSKKDGSKFEKEDETDFAFRPAGERAEGGYLPSTVAVWAGIPLRGGHDDTQDDLAALNDSEDTFEPIITMIKDTL